MEVILSGIFINLRDSQCLNADSSMIDKLSGSLIAVNDLHPPNAQ